LILIQKNKLKEIGNTPLYIFKEEVIDEEEENEQWTKTVSHFFEENGPERTHP